VVTWGVVVSLVAAVFAAFVAVNMHDLFGGESLVRERAALTYASYLHAGFAQLLVATALSVCLVVVGHVLLRAGDDARAKVPGGVAVRALEGTLLVLSGITVVSCWQRLRIYEDAYGASHLRLGVAFVEAMILGVLVLTLAKSFWRGWRGYAGSSMALALGVSVVAAHFNADAYVGKRNLDRALAGRPLDTAYLAELTSDAAALLDHPAVRADPELTELLADAYCKPAPSDLRAFRGMSRCDAPGAAMER
jgi:hypothetical protein